MIRILKRVEIRDGSVSHMYLCSDKKLRSIWDLASIAGQSATCLRYRIRTYGETSPLVLKRGRITPEEQRTHRLEPVKKRQAFDEGELLELKTRDGRVIPKCTEFDNMLTRSKPAGEGAYAHLFFKDHEKYRSRRSTRGRYDLLDGVRKFNKEMVKKGFLSEKSANASLEDIFKRID